MPLISSLLVTASAGAAALAAASCGSTTASFAGTEHPALVSPDDVIDFGVDRPEGHAVIGVASVRCETTNGASGLLEVPCTEESMTALIRRRASEAGGTGVVELRCDSVDQRRVLENVDGGTVQQSTLGGLVCHATVVRRGEGVVVGAPPRARTASSSPQAGRRVSISGQPVEVGADGPAAGAPSADVGEMEHFPDGYEDLGRVWGRCVHGCARSLARRAMLQEASRHGAQAVAELSCTLDGERWRCTARMVGAPANVARPSPPSPAWLGAGGAGGAEPALGSPGGGPPVGGAQP